MINHDEELPMLDATLGDGQLIRDLTEAATGFHHVEDTDGTPRVAVMRVDPNGYDSWSLEQFEDRPWRKSGVAKFFDADSFVHYVQIQAADDLGVYASYDECIVKAVFDDHTSTGPGWRQFVANYEAKLTDEWNAWTRMSGQYVTALELAEFFEEWRHTIADPSTADLLDMVRHFRATKKVTFRDEHIDRSGDRTLEYVTETEAQGKGELPIPDHLTLALVPIEGAEVVEIQTRFRYRLNDGRATFGVVLEQPSKVLADVFDAEVHTIAEALGVTVMRGRPAA